MSRRLGFGAVVFGLAVASQSASAAVVTEYFNGYGSSDTAVSNTGTAGGGWGGAWNNSNNNYGAGKQLTYAGAGYSNVGNGSAATDGLIESTATTTTTTISGRALSPALTGTIWISALTRLDANDDDVLFWLDSTGNNNNNFVALRGGSSNGDTNSANGPEPYIRYNNVNQTSVNTAYAINTTHLLLVKVDMNVSGGATDSVSYWVNPDVSGGGDGILTEADLGSPTYSGSGTDVFGPDFGGVAVSFSSSLGNQLDAIRISTDGLAAAVPEPSSAALVAVGLVGLARRRRRCP